MRGGNGFDIEGVGVGVGRRGMEVQPSTRDLCVCLIALEASSSTSELHIYLQEMVLQRFSGLVEGNDLFPQRFLVLQ